MQKRQNFQDKVTKSVICLAITLLILTQSASGAGVTILTHGFQGAQQEVIWLDSMESVVQSQWIDPLSQAPQGNTGLIMFDEIDGNFFPSINAWPTAVGSSDAAEITVVLNWSAVAGIFTPIEETRSDSTSNASEKLFSTTEVANSIVNFFTQPQFGLPALVQLPIHLVGHSRGGSLVSELTRLFGERGIWVDQMTTLDPHPLIFTDADPLVFENVLFADNYYQDNSTIFVPDGRPITGAYNRLLGQTELAAGGYSSQHSDIHLWYHGTVDKRYGVDITDGEALLTSSLRNIWYEPGEHLGTMTGYRFSRLAESLEGSIRNSEFTPEFGGDQVNSGYSVLMGGAGVREPLDKSAAVWPNIIRLDLFRDGVTLDAGDWYVPIGGALGLRFWSVSYNSPWIDDFFLDTDRNPYNGFASPTPIISTGLWASTVSPLQLSVGLNTSGIAPNDSGYYFCGRISDANGQHVRYLYATPKIIFFDRPPNTIDTIEAVDTYVDAFRPDINYCASDTLLAGSGQARITLMQFDLSGVSETIVNARLHLWVDNFIPAPTRLSLYRIKSPVWEPCQVTWQDDFSVDTIAIASRPFSVRGWVEIDMTSQVRQWVNETEPNFGFVITGYPESIGGYVVFGSAESGHKPFLEIERDISTAVQIISDPTLPNGFALGRNYPNPFNPETKIPFSVPHATAVKVTALNILGQVVATLFDSRVSAGQHVISWDGRTDAGVGLASGIYFYRMQFEGKSFTQKMLLIK